MVLHRFCVVVVVHPHLAYPRRWFTSTVLLPKLFMLSSSRPSRFRFGVSLTAEAFYAPDILALLSHVT